MALWLAQVTKSWLVRGARWGLAVLAVVAIFANVPTFASVVVPPKPKPTQWVRADPNLPLTDLIPMFFTAGTYKQYIKPGENVVLLSHRGNAGMMFQAYTDFYYNVAGGFINASLSQENALPAPIDLLTHLPGKVGKERVEAAQAYIQNAHIGAFVVERAWSEKWMYVFGTSAFGFKSTTVGGVTIYQVPQNYKAPKS